MKRINQAYEMLKNPDTRQLYDRLRAPTGQNGTLRQGIAGATPYTQRNDPYLHIRAGYQQRWSRVRLSTLGLPPWARAVAGLCAGAGLVVGFVLGLPFGIIGCLPGALVGVVAGMVVGLLAVYLCALGLPTALSATAGWWLAETPGMWIGGTVGLALGVLWAYRLWQRMQRYARTARRAPRQEARGFTIRV